MKLEVYERIVLLNILPQEGDFTTLKLVRKLRESLSFSEKEIADIDFKNTWNCPVCQKFEAAPHANKCQGSEENPHEPTYMKTGGEVTWDDEKAKNTVKDIHMGDKMYALCVTTLSKLNDEKKLTEQHMGVYEKFIKVNNE